MNFIEIDGQRHGFGDAELWLYHCASSEADWILRTSPTAQGSAPLWLAGTVGPSPSRPEALHERALEIEVDAIDELFAVLLGGPITVYPNGEDVCRAHFVAEWSDEGLMLFAGFDFDCDRETGPEDAAQRRARLEFRARVVALYTGGLPEDAVDTT